MSDDTSTREPGIGQRSLGRRDLLKIGATSAVVPAVLGPTAAAERTRSSSASDQADQELAAGPFSVGFWSGTGNAGIINARGMTSGDPSFDRYGAQISMIGMANSGSAAKKSGLECLDVDLEIGSTSYRAWSYDARAVLNVSAPSTFAVPVDGSKGLVFSITSTSAGLKGVPKSASLILSTGGKSGLAKLQAGYYVIAPGAHGKSPRINWANFRIAGDGSGQSLVLRYLSTGELVESFPYLIFSVALNTPDSRFV